MFGITTGSLIVPEFEIDARADVNNPLPLMVPEFETVPELENVPELIMVPELMMVPEFEREMPELIVSV